MHFIAEEIDVFFYFVDYFDIFSNVNIGEKENNHVHVHIDNETQR